MGKRVKENLKNNRVTVRFTDAEREKLDRKAKEAGISLAELIRRTVTERPLNYTDIKHYNDLVREIGWIGNNINQIAHNANCGYYNESMSRKLLANMAELKEYVEKAVENHGNN